MSKPDKQKLLKFTYQGKLADDVTLDFGNHTVTLDKDVEYVVVIVKVNEVTE